MSDLATEALGLVLVLWGGVLLATGALGVSYTTRPTPKPLWDDVDGFLPPEEPDDRLTVGIVTAVLLVAGLSLTAVGIWWWVR